MESGSGFFNGSDCQQKRATTDLYEVGLGEPRDPQCCEGVKALFFGQDEHVVDQSLAGDGGCDGVP